MTVQNLEHYNIRTVRYSDTVKFYDAALGMQAQRVPGSSPDRPPTWICNDAGVPLVHLIVVDPANAAESYAKIAGERVVIAEKAAFEGSGAIDHIAFACEDFEAVKDRLKSAGIPFFENSPQGLGLRQLFLKDPNGVTLELNFRDE